MEKQNYFSLEKIIIEHNENMIEQISNRLKKCGFSFIKLPSKIVDLIDKALNDIDFFFKKENEYKKYFEKKPIFGYFNVEHKESFRLLTKERLDEYKLPNNFENIIELIKLLDKLMYDLTIILSKYLFPKTKIHRYTEISLFDGHLECLI